MKVPSKDNHTGVDTSSFPESSDIAFSISIWAWKRREDGSVYSAAQAGHIVAWARGQQRQFQSQRGVRLVYPSDEFYLLANQPVPSARSYDGFPQLANGIGLTRLLLDDWTRARRRVTSSAWSHRKATLVCGALIAPVLRNLTEELGALLHSTIEVLAVPNRFFGSTVTVSGLLMAADVIAALQAYDPGDLVVLPRVMFDAQGEWTLDNRTLADIRGRLGVEVVIAECLSEILCLQTGTTALGHPGAGKRKRPLGRGAQHHNSGEGGI